MPHTSPAAHLPANCFAGDEGYVQGMESSPQAHRCFGQRSPLPFLHHWEQLGERCVFHQLHEVVLELRLLPPCFVSYTLGDIGRSRGRLNTPYLSSHDAIQNDFACPGVITREGRICRHFDVVAQSVLSKLTHAVHNHPVICIQLLFFFKALILRSRYSTVLCLNC